MYQYNRAYQLTINDRETGTLYTIQSGGIGDDSLRVKFDIQKNVDNRATTNTASLKVYNLSQDTLDKLSQKELACQVVLKVGYGGELVEILVGDVLQIQTNQDGSEIETEFVIYEGFAALNAAKISKTYPENSTIKDVITDLSTNNDVPIKSISGDNSLKTLAYGFPAFGTFKQILDEMCYANDLEWDIGNGNLTVKDKRGRTPDATKETAIVLNYETGMIGIPQTNYEKVSTSVDVPLQSNEGRVTPTETTNKRGNVVKAKTLKKIRFNVECKALLNPQCKPNVLVKIESFKAPNLSGYYRVRTIKYSGDTRGGEWHMNMWCDNVEDL
jgi:hypothetical protein